MEISPLEDLPHKSFDKHEPYCTRYCTSHYSGSLKRTALHIYRASSCISHYLCIGTVAQIYFHTGVLILSTLASKVQRGAPGLPDDYARYTASTYDFSNGVGVEFGGEEG